MPKYRVSASVTGSKFLGVFEADSPEEAEKKAVDKNGHVSLCHQCASECEDGEIGEVFVELTIDGNEPDEKGE